MEFIAAQTDPVVVAAEYARSEVLGAEIEAWIEAGSATLPVLPAKKRTWSYTVRRWAVRDGQIVTWDEKVTEEI